MSKPNRLSPTKTGKGGSPQPARDPQAPLTGVEKLAILNRYVFPVDAVDTVTAKIELIKRAQAAGVPIISCMGTGNKLDPSRFEITDITKTSVCPLAKVMRRELKKRGITKLKVLYSKEEPIKHTAGAVPGSVSFVPSVAGLMIAGEVIKDLLREEK